MKKLSWIMVVAALTGTAARLAAPLIVQVSGLRFELRVAPPDEQLPGPGMGPGMSPGMMGPPGGMGPGMGPAKLGSRNTARPLALPPGSAEIEDDRGPGGPMGPGNPLALLEQGSSPTHAVYLSIKNKQGRGVDAFPVRLVAVRRSNYDLTVTILPPAGALGKFAGNVSLPGKGVYKLVVRIRNSNNQPTDAKFDFNY